MVAVLNLAIIDILKRGQELKDILRMVGVEGQTVRLPANLLILSKH